jgi:hypothetical protein
MPNKLRVFLCHASQDKPIVRELYKALQAEGWIEPWLDKEELLPGHDWGLEIEKAVETSDLILVCLSKSSVNKEGYVQKELRLVLAMTMNMPEGEIFLIPLKLEECEIPRRLRTWQWLEFFPPANRAAAYKKLLASLKLRADKLGIPTGQQTNAARFEPAPIKETPPVKTETPLDLDLYLPPEYSPNTFTPPKAKVPSWILGGMEFVKVPHGEFLMGSNDKDKQAADNEKPQHTFEIRYDFLIARFPVTNEQFAVFGV